MSGFLRVLSASISLIACTNGRSPALQAPVVLPFELRNDLVVLHAEVNGHPALLALDTGSGASALDSAFAVEAGIEMNGPQANVQGSRDMTMRLGTAKSIRLGSAEVTGAWVVPTSRFGAVQALTGYDVRGTIGYEVFARYVVTIDYAARTVTLSEPKEFAYAGQGTTLLADTRTRVPVVDASIVTRKSGTLKARLGFDLGSTRYAVRLSARLVNAHDLTNDTVAVTGLTNIGVGGASEGRLMRMPRLLLGNLVFERPSVALSVETEGNMGPNAQSDGTIGVPVFGRALVIVDYSRSHIILEPRGRLDLPDSVDASGVLFAVEPPPARAFRVLYVMKGTSGDTSGVLKGDELLRIDDRDATRLTLQQVRELLRTTGVTRRLTLRRGDQTVTVSLPLRMVF